MAEAIQNANKCNGHNGHKCLRDRVDPETLTGHFIPVIHKIRHASDDELANDQLFKALSAEEKENMKELLLKAITGWGE